MGETPGKMHALAAILTLLAIAAAVLRVYARRITKMSLGWDDYVIFPALISTMGTAICMFVGASLGDLGRHTQIGPDGAPVVTERTRIFLKINFASQLTQTLTFGFTKLAVLLFYNRIFIGDKFTLVANGLIAIVVAWTVAFFLSNLLQCIPIWQNWTGFGGTVETCIDTKRMYLAQAHSDVVTDVMILLMPIPRIWALQMPTKRKVAVCSIFLLGTLVVGAGIAKLVVFHEITVAIAAGDLDITYLLTPTLYWPMVESSLGIVGACLPLMRPIWTHLASHNLLQAFRKLSSLSTGQSRLASRATGPGSNKSTYTVSPASSASSFPKHAQRVRETQNNFNSYFGNDVNFVTPPKFGRFTEVEFDGGPRADDNV